MLLHNAGLTDALGESMTDLRGNATEMHFVLPYLGTIKTVGTVAPIGDSQTGLFLKQSQRVTNVTIRVNKNK